MMSLTQIAAAVIAVGSIGGSAVALNELHVSRADFDAYLEQQQISDDREFVRKIKADIREVMLALKRGPDQYLEETLAELIDELCEIRPEDRLCQDGE